MAILIKLVGKYGEGKSAIIDDDMASLTQYTWRATRGGYVYRAAWSKEVGNNISIYLHREIMNCPKNLTVDHLDRNPLDNRKKNLEIMTLRENLLNRRCKDCGELPDGIKKAYSAVVNGKIKYFDTINEAVIKKYSI